MEKYVIFVLCVILSSTVAAPPKITKQYRDDYVYNKKTDAFYKLHIEMVGHPWAYDLCAIEGAQLMIPTSDFDIMQLHSMFKQFPDLGDCVWVGDNGQKHESAEEQPIIDLSPKRYGEEYNQILMDTFDRCDAVTRTGDIENINCYQKLPFICKVDAKEAPYDEHCGVYRKGYTYYSSVGSCYTIPRMATFTWSQAYSECQADGAHLLVINSEEEHDAIFNLTNTKEKFGWQTALLFYFVGIRADKPVGDATPVFKTIFNQTLEEAGYSEWTDSKPINALSKELCGSIIRNDAKLVNVECTYQLSFICEKEVHLIS